MDPDCNSWEIFEETGDPLAYVLYRARLQMEAGEELFHGDTANHGPGGEVKNN